MATYFIRSDAANDAGAGTSWETAKKTLAAGLALLAAGDTLLIRGEFYSQGLALPNRANTLITNDVGYPVLVDGEGTYAGHVLAANSSNPVNQRVVGTIENGRHMFRVRRPAAGYHAMYMQGNMTVDGLAIDTPSADRELIYLNSGNMLITRLKGSGAKGTLPVVSMYNSFQGTLSHCVFESLDAAAALNGRVILHSATLNAVTNIYNCVLYGTQIGPIIRVSNNAKTLNIFNNVIGPIGIESESYNGEFISLAGSSPTVNHGKNIYIPQMLNSGFAHAALNISTMVAAQSVNAGGNIIDASRIQRGQYDAYIMIGVDDGDYAYADTVATIAEQFGSKISWWINQKNHTIASANPAAAAAMITTLANRGHDIGAHTRSHSVMSDMRAMNVQYTGGAGAANLTIANNVFSVIVPGNAAHNFSMDISTATIEQLCDALNATGVYSAPMTATGAGKYTILISAGPVAQFAYALAQGLADTTVDISTSRTLSYERNRFYKNEVDDVIDWLKTFEGVESVWSGSTGYNSGDATYTSYARTKFVSSRGHMQTLATPLVRNIDLFGILTRSLTGMLGPDGTYDANGIRVRARLLAENILANGTAVCCFCHNATEISPASWNAMFEEWAKYPRLWVGSQRDFANLVLTDERWTQNGTRYERSMVADADYTPSPDSPAIDAGATALVSTDLYGGAIPALGGPDIGPVEYMPGWTLFDSTMPALSLADTAPGKLLEVQEWKKAGVTKKQIDKVSK